MNRLKLLFPICALGFLFFACEAEPVEEALEANFGVSLSELEATENFANSDTDQRATDDDDDYVDVDG